MIDWKQTHKPNWLLPAAVTLIGLALFPYGWLADQWPLFDWVMDLIFGTELSHIVGHLGLFAAVGTAVILIFPRLQARPRLYFGLIALVGLLQEILQLTTFKERPFGVDEGLDLTVDLLGAALIFIWKQRQERR